MNRILVFAAAAVILIGVWLGISSMGTDNPGTQAFAQAASQIQKAKTITWKETFYERYTNKDNTKTWIRTSERECAFRSPGLLREVYFDEPGQMTSVEITDIVQRKQLIIIPGEKKATLRESIPANEDPNGPFTWVEKKLREADLQWVGKRKTAQGEVNVFRRAYFDKANGHDWSEDFWLDSQTKQLVAFSLPGADLFDPDKEKVSNEPLERGWQMTVAGCVKHDIAFDVPLDDALFRLEPPEGYTLETQQKLPPVTEKEMLEYLDVLANFNDQTFPDQMFPYDISSDRINKSWSKPEKDRTPAEQRLVTYLDQWLSVRAGGPKPMYQFLLDNAVDDTFRYLGKGVKLGDKERIVCWYKLKGATTYRVVYGDLSVKDMAEKDLPLPVQP